MRVDEVRLTNVRCHRGLRIHLGPGLTVLVGANGAGKTTVLEALALVLRGEPMRAGSVRELITRGEEHLRVEVDLEESGRRVTAAAAYSRSGEKRLTADGAPLESPARWSRMLPLCTFLPDDLRLIKGSPRHRRRYLDGLALRSFPQYGEMLSCYEEALAQRNSLLRAPAVDLADATFAPWERLLARSGLALARLRAQVLASLAPRFQEQHAALTGASPETCRLLYRTNTAGLDEEDYEKRLRESRALDRRRTYTGLGPHRDDLVLMAGGMEVREFASQGEQRTALLALVLSEWQWHRQGTHPPLLLLDDVMSELDAARRRALISLLRGESQVVITAADRRYFTDVELGTALVLEVSPGRVFGEGVEW